MKKLTTISLFIFFCVVTAVLTAGLVFYQNNQKANPGNTNTSGTTVNNQKSNNTKSTGSGTLTVSEISKHNTIYDCWIIVNSKVYNISDYASSHPGGVRNIANYCGKESTQAYDTKGGQGGGHSASAHKELDQFFVGNLQ